MSGARDQVGRLLALVPYLNARGQTPLADVAAHLGVSEEQVVRDLKVLWYCGLPGLGMGDLIDVDFDALEGEGVVRVSNAEYLSRPLRLGATEAAGLIVALRTLRDAVTDDVRPVVERALAKLEGAAEDGADLAGRVDVRLPEHQVATVDLRRRLARAVDGGRQVELDYWVPARDETTHRVVDPIAVVTAEGHDYLDAWCHQAEDRRLFRLDRMVDVRVLDAAALAHPDLAPREMSAGLFTPGPGDLVATLDLAPSARWVAEYYPVRSVEDAADGSLRVVLEVGDPRWLERLVLRLAPDAVLADPPDIAERVRATAHAALQELRVTRVRWGCPRPAGRQP